MPKIFYDLKKLLIELDLSNSASLSFHHHLRSGDKVINTVLAGVKAAGLKDIKVKSSALFATQAGILDLIEDQTVSEIEVSYLAIEIGKAISQGILDKPVIFRSHGGRADAIMQGYSEIDYAFIAAPTVDRKGNITGKLGPSSCGSLGYAIADAHKAKQVIAVSDNLLDAELENPAIPGSLVDYILVLDSIGDAAGIVSGTTKISKDPLALLTAKHASSAIINSPYFKDGLSFQTGAGGISLATAQFLSDEMKKAKIKGSFAMGGITGYLVKMLEDGLFDKAYDVQCFDLEAIRSIRENPRHLEISASQYASSLDSSSYIHDLDVVILGATELDLNFNVNVHTDSNGYIMGGSGGHSDTAFGSKLAIVVAPLIRSRLPLIVNEVQAETTPGKDIDLLVTPLGMAINPLRDDLINHFDQVGVKHFKLEKLKEIAEKMTGIPAPISKGKRQVAIIKQRLEAIEKPIFQVH